MRSCFGAATVSLLAGTALALAADPAAIDFRFDRLNDTYENLVTEVDPIQSGPLILRLSSPENTLTLRSNRLELEPSQPNSHRVRLSARFEGEGVLVAEVDFAGIPARFEDRVVFPDQETVIEAQVRIGKEESGYRVEAEELPSHVEIAIESPLGKRLVSWCERLAFFVVGDAGCDDLDRRLSRPSLPLPPPGSEFFVSAEELTPEERARLDLYLTNH